LLFRKIYACQDFAPEAVCYRLAPGNWQHAFSTVENVDNLICREVVGRDHMAHDISSEKVTLGVRILVH